MSAHFKPEDVGRLITPEELLAWGCISPEVYNALAVTDTEKSATLITTITSVSDATTIRVMRKTPRKR